MLGLRRVPPDGAGTRVLLALDDQACPTSRCGTLAPSARSQLVGRARVRRPRSARDVRFEFSTLKVRDHAGGIGAGPERSCSRTRDLSVWTIEVHRRTTSTRRSALATELEDLSRASIRCTARSRASCPKIRTERLATFTEHARRPRDAARADATTRSRRRRARPPHRDRLHDRGLRRGARPRRGAARGEVEDGPDDQREPPRRLRDRAPAA